MPAQMNNGGSSRVILAVFAAIFLSATVSCTTKSANLQQPAAPTPEVQTEQTAELLSPLELLKSGSATPGRFNSGEISTSIFSYRLQNNSFFPIDVNHTGDLRLQAYAAYQFNTGGYDGPYGLLTQWLDHFGNGNYGDLWVGLSEWESNSWSWTLTDEGFIGGSVVEQHISVEGDLLVALVLGHNEVRTIEWLRVGSDIPPTAYIVASGYMGVSPMTVTLSAVGSEDCEGELEYAWDEIGDGTFTEYGSSPEHSFTLTGQQTARSVVRVRDSANNTADAALEQPIVILGPPAMLLTMVEKPGSAYMGGGLGTLEAPYFLDEYVDGKAIFLDVNTMPDGSGEVIDPASLYWQLIGDPIEGVLSWTAPGELLIGEIRTSIIGAVAYDDEGNHTNVVYFLRGSPEGYEVVLCFTMNQTTGDYPLRVDLDHTMSYLTGGEFYPESVRWDFDGDEVEDHITPFGLWDHGMDGASYVFHEPGTYNLTARPVSEYNESPEWKSFSQVITVTDGGGPKWHFNNIPLPNNLGTSSLSRWRPVDLIEVQGKPVVLASTDDWENEDQTFIIRATDNLGIAWEDTATIMPVGDSYISNFTLVDGKPAVLIEYGELKYMQALDAEGRTWGTPVTIYDDVFVSEELVLADVNGSPSVAYLNFKYPGDDEITYLGYDGVTEPNGWFSVVLDSFDHVYYEFNLALNTIDERPAIAYSFLNSSTGENEVRFISALDGIGQGWGTPIVVASNEGRSFGRQPSLTVVNGIPAVCYLADLGNPSTLGYSMATVSDGGSWIPRVEFGKVVAIEYEFDTWMFAYKNRPLIFTKEIASLGADVLQMSIPEDGEGAYWSEATPVFATSFEDVDTAIIDGKPAVVMVRRQWDDQTETFEPELRFGMLY